MEFRIWVEARLGGRVLERQLVAQVEREASGIGPEEIGLTLEEGKTVLRKVQARMIQTQVEAVEAAHRKCVQCGRNQRIKDRRTRCVRTVFGAVRVSCRRYLRCTCRGGKRIALWPLNGRQLPGTTPELESLYATWGSSIPYRRAAALLGELLPICKDGVSTLRCGVVPLQSVHGSISGSSSQPSTTGPSPGANPFPQPSVSALPLTEPMFELMG